MADGGGLENRYGGDESHRGFESHTLRHHTLALSDVLRLDITPSAMS